jgi:hypothetical protein
MGIEPTAQAWEAWVLPLYDARYAAKFSRDPRSPQIAEIPAGESWARSIRPQTRAETPGAGRRPERRVLLRIHKMVTRLRDSAPSITG